MIAVVCDNCGKTIPVKKITINNLSLELLDRGKVACSEWSCDKLFRNKDLCKPCAATISLALNYEMLKLKENIMK